MRVVVLGRANEGMPGRAYLHTLPSRAPGICCCLPFRVCGRDSPSPALSRCQLLKSLPSPVFWVDKTHALPRRERGDLYAGPLSARLAAFPPPQLRSAFSRGRLGTALGSLTSAYPWRPPPQADASGGWVTSGAEMSFRFWFSSTKANLGGLARSIPRCISHCSQP